MIINLNLNKLKGVQMEYNSKYTKLLKELILKYKEKKITRREILNLIPQINGYTLYNHLLTKKIKIWDVERNFVDLNKLAKDAKDLVNKKTTVKQLAKKYKVTPNAIRVNLYSLGYSASDWGEREKRKKYKDYKSKYFSLNKLAQTSYYADYLLNYNK